jgi:hypothetical protein
VEIGRGSSDATCPVAAIETWIKFAKIAYGPLFRRVTGLGKAAGPERLNDKEPASNRAIITKKIAEAAASEIQCSFMARLLRLAIRSATCHNNSP